MRIMGESGFEICDEREFDDLQLSDRHLLLFTRQIESSLYIDGEGEWGNECGGRIVRFGPEQKKTHTK